ncbi:MAG: L-threonylcarbamoyladenylate synthase [Gaiellales bacterium]|nr:L-threonylcarbamoyladenylate synthase [Gaiellales bacterium]
MGVTVPADAERRLRAGELAILPTDTVYGLAAAAYLRGACTTLYELKERPADQPTAVVLGSVDNLLENVLPELMGRQGVIAGKVFPGPITLVVRNPGRRFAYLCGSTPERIGIRVPDLAPAVARLADGVGGLLMTSANRRGEPAPARLEDVPQELRDAAAFAVDAGDLPGTPSAVIDVTGAGPRVLRDGPGLDDALARLAGG